MRARRGIPARLLTDLVEVRPYLGNDARGPVHGPAQTFRGRLEAGRTVAASRTEGRTRTDQTRVIVEIGAGEVLRPEALVEVNGRPVEVLTVQVRAGGGLPVPEHVEATIR